MYVLMIVPSNFPNADAGAVRDLSFAEIYQELGYDVILIGMGREKKMGVYCGVKYCSLYRDRKTAWDHLSYYLDYKKRCLRYIDRITEKKGMPALIHLNEVEHGLMSYLISFSEKKEIPVIHDSTEWYSPCEFKHGKWDKAYILKDRLNRKIIRNPVKVVSISEYLRKYFDTRGIQTVRIPVIMDVMSIKPIKSVQDKKIKLIYAGSPAAKDHLREIIVAVQKLPSSSQGRIELHIFGVSEEQLIELSNIVKIPACIRVYGRVPREEVLECMMKMDFSLLLRPSEERYAKAGFPTKSVEAMAHGVAMMCNISSDLDMYLKDGENAVIVSGCSAEAFKKALEKVVSMERTEINKIKRSARILAEKEFDYRNYTSTVKQLIGRKL